MISINLYAQPGAGKSTTAAKVFSYFKNKGYNIELITEYAKQLVYSRRQSEMTNQIYLLAKQYKKMKDIEEYGHVPVVVTDCPLKLGLIYCKKLPYFKEFKALVKKLDLEFTNINVLIKRTKKYNPSGRNQTEKQSDELAKEVEKLVEFDYVINGDKKGQKKFCKTLKKLFKNRDFAPKKEKKPKLNKNQKKKLKKYEHIKFSAKDW